MRIIGFFLWLIQGIVLLALTMLGLMAIDYYVSPDWLYNDNIVFFILGLVFFIHFIFGIKRSNKRHIKKQTYEDIYYDEYQPVKTHHLHTKKPNYIRQSFLACSLVALLLIGLGVHNISKQNELDGVPENVIEFGEKYPEAEEYVKNFNKYAYADFDMDVSDEMSKKDIPLFIQWDKRWGYKNYGANYVGVAGCGPTCLAMVVCGLEQDADINPYVVAEYASDKGYYTYGQGTSWDIMTEGARHYGLSVSSGNVSSEYITDNLSSETPMICSMSPGDFTKTGHFIVLTGIDSNGKIIVNDPNSPKNSNKHWDVNTLVSQMKSVWKYNI